MIGGERIIDAEFRVLRGANRPNESAYSALRLAQAQERRRRWDGGGELARMAAAQIRSDRRNVVAFVRQQRHFPWPFRKLRFTRI